ncbi:glycosyl hydrolase family 95 catalytic domain-containing protein [Phocaeicola sp.]
MKLKTLLLLGCTLGMMSCNNSIDLCPVTASDSDLTFPSLAQSWDEGVPLGNATVGALVWQRDSTLRFSLDRTDLWDLRPTDSLSGNNYRFAWVKQQIRKKDYLPVQKKFDWPYDRMPAPSKIPGASLEFPLTGLGEPSQVRLYLNNALCEATWEDGTQMQTFVHATEPVGWFIFKNLKTELKPVLVTPVYNKAGTSEEASPVSGQDLQRLGYEQGTVTCKENQIVYHQKGYGDFSYDVAVNWKQQGNTLYGTWSVTSSLSTDQADKEAGEAMQRGVKQDYQAHINYWNHYWAQSSITLPDAVLQKQYQNEMYKFGSATREDSYPISLQAVWTADNGKLPPWKGDYHHDLNTQLSYWPAYIGNHLTEGMGYLNTLWNQRDTYKRYTRQYFETEGMNIPGVCTLTGEPMGGWIQYAMSQTVGAWLAQHFYLHWKYSADRDFLKERAYPFLKEVATYMEQNSIVNEKGVRKLEFSSSPEIYDNSLQAWFPDMTNFDLSLMHFLFEATSELAGELGMESEAGHWEELKKQLPEFDLDKEGSLTFAKGFPYNASHRHFSHALAIHPLGVIDWSDGEKAQSIIRATLKKLQDYGPDYWTGYTYSWFANMQARAFNGEEAAKALRTFAECFCLKNTFHVNGDQSGTGKSKFTYRPFTLEGNFAFASGIQEMLLQSHTGVIHVFPAIPENWNDVSFENLRAMGAFLVSAIRKDGKVTKLRIYSEKGSDLKIVSPTDGKLLQYKTQPGEWIEII